MNFRASYLLDRCSTTWATPPGLFCFSCFSGRVSHFCLGWPGLWSSYLCLLCSQEHMACHHAWLIDRDGGPINFLPVLALNCDCLKLCSLRNEGLDAWGFLLFPWQYSGALTSQGGVLSPEPQTLPFFLSFSFFLRQSLPFFSWCESWTTTILHLPPCSWDYGFMPPYLGPGFLLLFSKLIRGGYTQRNGNKGPQSLFAYRCILWDLSLY
jgi:hypothetical protein